jgi:hypothetical protein
MPTESPSPRDPRRSSPVERVLERASEGAPGGGRPLSDRARQAQRSVESYLLGSGRPRWMERLIEIDRGTKREQRLLEEAYAEVLEECGDDRARFRRRWRAIAEAWSFDELNELIRTHNEWYPVERDLPMDMRTRDYVLVNGRSYRRRELDAEWILEQFPLSRSRTASAAAPGTPPRP